MTLVKAAFLDRDGVINVDNGYVYKWEEFEFIPGYLDALKALQENGYLLFIVTNQSGIARGIYTTEEYELLTNAMVNHLSINRINISEVYHCPHLEGSPIEEYNVACDCRKPKPGLLIRAATEWAINLSESILIGDKASDIAAAKSAGIGKTYRIKDVNDLSTPQVGICYKNLIECVRNILPEKLSGGK